MNPVIYQSCFLRLPYGSILATLISVCGVVIALVSLGQSTAILDRILTELLHRKQIWHQEARWLYSSFSIMISVVVLINLLIGCMTTGRHITSYRSPGSGSFCDKLASILFRTIFAINYALFFIILVLTIAFAIILFSCFIMSKLCSDGHTYSDPASSVATSMGGSSTAAVHPMEISDNNNQLNLKILAPIINLKGNDTNLLIFKGHRLKKLCIDYVSSLYLYVILTFSGFMLLSCGFLNFLINLSVNWARITTRRKCAELIYINGPEMTGFVNNIKQGRF
ncbi:uncharacterized protein LOC141851966 [Brevipalpus obovatus]|uniref:uncharacterized protein LOC141851966 n=1 Tax=Brevipalpus obovatus TaxID=246614 RepID=UPI003D9F11B6